MLDKLEAAISAKEYAVGRMVTKCPKGRGDNLITRINSQDYLRTCWASCGVMGKVLRSVEGKKRRPPDANEDFSC